MTASDFAPETNAYLDLTQHEIQALKTSYNLADAHTHQEQSETQRDIVSSLPSLWYEAEEGLQADFEQRFINAFFRLHNQPTALARGKTLLSYAASISTMVAAMFLQQRKMTVALIEPCFDNLHDILKNMQIEMHPLPEASLADPKQIYSELSRRVTADAVFLVDPNNPTGSSLLRHGTEAFREVARYCKDHDKLFVLDTCFASFTLFDDQLARIDIYKLLEEIGTSYIVIEDTGKTWPVQDAKCALISASDDIWDEIYNIHTSVLLNVSPFVLNFLANYIEDSIEDSFASVRDLLTQNCETAKKKLYGSLLEYQEPAAKVSVAWFRIARTDLTASELQKILIEDEVYVLPGTYFYWSNPAKGEQYIRIALARRPEMFTIAMDRLRGALDRLEQ